MAVGGQAQATRAWAPAPGARPRELTGALGRDGGTARLRIAITTVPITCRRDADLHADREASAAASEAQDGDAMPLALLITTTVREHLQKDQACMRERRQAEASPRAQATPDSTTRQPPGHDRHDGAFSTPSRGAHGGQEQPEQRKMDEITPQTTTPRMRTFLAE